MSGPLGRRVFNADWSSLYRKCLRNGQNRLHSNAGSTLIGLSPEACPGIAGIERGRN